jgi:hypothetical protein
LVVLNKKAKNFLKNSAAVGHGVKGLPLAALAQEFDSCRRTPRRQGLNAVRCGDRSLMLWATASDEHFSKILIGPIISENHDKLNIYKKNQTRGSYDLEEFDMFLSWHILTAWAA